MANKEKWARKPNWYLSHNGNYVACWYSETKRQAKEVANAHVSIAKSNNYRKPVKLRIYKKDFNLSQMYKGADDA